MPRYWIIAPIESKPKELFDKVWQFDLANNLISIGWVELGDVSKLSRHDLAEAVAAKYPEKPQATKSLFTGMIWAFYHEIVPGDLIIARRGRKTLAAVGEVTRSAVYSPGKSPFHGHPNFLEVAWKEQPRNKEFLDVVFPMHTLAETSAEKFNNIVQGKVDIVSLPAKTPEDIDAKAFVLEKYLEEFIITNFHAIFKGGLKIYEDTEGNGGEQYDTERGTYRYPSD